MLRQMVKPKSNLRPTAGPKPYPDVGYIRSSEDILNRIELYARGYSQEGSLLSNDRLILEHLEAPPYKAGGESSAFLNTLVLKGMFVQRYSYPNVRARMRVSKC